MADEQKTKIFIRKKNRKITNECHESNPSVINIYFWYSVGLVHGIHLDLSPQDIDCD